VISLSLATLDTSRGVQLVTAPYVHYVIRTFVSFLLLNLRKSQDGRQRWKKSACTLEPGANSGVVYRGRSSNYPILSLCGKRDVSCT